MSPLCVGNKQSGITQLVAQNSLTGVQPPKNVPRDSTGLERPSAFFDSDSPRVNNNYSSPNKSAHKGASRRSEGGQRGRERPDMHAEIGEVGR